MQPGGNISPIDEPYFENLRQKFGVFRVRPDIAYLDSASTAQNPTWFSMP